MNLIYTITSMVLNLHVAPTPLLSLRPHPIRGIHSLNSILIRVRIKMIQGLQPSILAEKNPTLDKVGKRFRELIVHVRPGWDSEDIVELFEGALFGFGYPEEDHGEGDYVRASVETKYAL